MIPKSNLLTCTTHETLILQPFMQHKHDVIAMYHDIHNGVGTLIGTLILETRTQRLATNTFLQSFHI